MQLLTCYQVEQLRMDNLKNQPADQTVLERFYFNQPPLKMVDNTGMFG